MAIMKNENLDYLLKKALSSKEAPDKELVQKIKKKTVEEEIKMERSYIKYSFRTVAVVMMVFVLLGTTAFAAWHFLNPSEVAEQVHDNALSAAFKSDTAVNINESVETGGYIFTLLAVVMGKDITDMPYYSEENIQDERTYAVLAIRNADGSPMPSTQDDDYGKVPFFATPLIKGFNPIDMNAATMNGGYSEIVDNGVTYRILECDDVSIFADHGLYFAVSTSSFYDINAYIYDEETGEIKANPDYDGASAVFDLPIDISLADPVKAKQYLESIQAESEEEMESEEMDDIFADIDWDKAVPIVSTIKKGLTVDENGMISFEYDCEYGSGTVSEDFSQHFTNDNTEQSAIICTAASDDKWYAVRFTKDEEGVISGMIVIPE